MIDHCNDFVVFNMIDANLALSRSAALVVHAYYNTITYINNYSHRRSYRSSNDGPMAHGPFPYDVNKPKVLS